MSKILITCYIDPDLDGLAGAFAYAEFLCASGRPAQAGVMGQPSDEARYVLKRFALSGPENINNALGFEEIILVDASDLNGLGGRISPEKVIEIIDHRQVNEAEKFSQAKIQIELVGAAATLIAEKFQQAENKVIISEAAAILLYSAIISNTLNFKAGVTTNRDRNAAAWLKKFIKLPADYWRELFLAKSDLTGEKLSERIISDFAEFTLGDYKIGVAQLEIIGAQDLISQRGDEIIAILEKIRLDSGLDYILQNTIELDPPGSFIVSGHAASRALLEQALHIDFLSHVAKTDVPLMRKQIMPLIKRALEESV